MKLSENLTKRITELTAEVEKAYEGKQKVESELSETTKRCADFQKKCAGFFDQVVSLNSKQQESEEEISSLKRSCENFRAQLAEKDAMMMMMRDSVSLFKIPYCM
jgi:peptidoglycan hydrolase CwlO-like protein